MALKRYSNGVRTVFEKESRDFLGKVYRLLENTRDFLKKGYSHLKKWVGIRSDWVGTHFERNSYSVLRGKIVVLNTRITLYVFYILTLNFSFHQRVFYIGENN